MDKDTKSKIDISKIKTKKDARDAVKKLSDALHFHNYRYYVMDSPVITDAEYDIRDL